MRHLIWEASFRRAFKRRTRRNPYLRERILEALAILAEDPLEPSLKTHKLHGQMEGLLACWVEYDCRIVFDFELNPPNADAILLVDIGSHDEVY